MIWKMKSRRSPMSGMVKDGRVVPEATDASPSMRTKRTMTATGRGKEEAIRRKRNIMRKRRKRRMMMMRRRPPR